MKKVLILGANGQTSKKIIPHLLRQDDVALSLLVRNTQQVKNVTHKNARVFVGDACDSDVLEQVIRGQDIVISTMGGMDLGVKIKSVVNMMELLGVTRIIALSAGGIYDELPEKFNNWDKMMTGHTRPTNLMAANVIEESSLIYTILRPVWLTDDTSEAYQLTTKGQEFAGTETSRASMGYFISEIVKTPSLYMRANLGISCPGTDGDKPRRYR